MAEPGQGAGYPDGASKPNYGVQFARVLMRNEGLTAGLAGSREQQY